uniref:P-loop NTPase n=1 Tax=Lachnospira eligens TaxID=39485 RepID=UPI003FEDD760
MSENCSGNCSGCSSDCESRKGPQILRNANNGKVKKVIAVVSGKGGVGKSLVTSMLAVKANKDGKKSAILDADITGPSIPKSFGLTERVKCNEDGTVMYPEISKNGIKVMSLNLLMEKETDPVIWRGPVIAGVVKQFWEDVDWDETDCMFVDCPPGTGDVPLTVFQSMPIDGIIIVTSPQDLVSMIVEKAINMAKLMNIPVLGIVENMSYFKCPDCGNIHYIYGKSKIDEVAAANDIKTVAKLPMDAKVAGLVDSGKAEELDVSALDGIFDAIMA